MLHKDGKNVGALWWSDRVSNLTPIKSMYVGSTLVWDVGDKPVVRITPDYGAHDQLRAALTDLGLDYRTVTVIPFGLDIQTTNLYRLFYDMSALRTAPAMVTSGVTRMTQMFQNCSSLTYIPDMDTSEVTNTANMLRDTASLQDGYVRLIGMHPDLTANSRLSMIRGSGLTREPFFDIDGNPIP